MFNYMLEKADKIRYPKLERENGTKFPDDYFRSEYINFLHSNIELVRNKFVFEKIPYDTVHEIILSDGYLIKNRWIIRALSFVAFYFSFKFIHFGLIVSGGLEKWNLAQWFNKGALITVWGPLILIVGAALALYQSFIKSPILTIKTNKAQHIVRIKYFEEKKTLNELQFFLVEKGLAVNDKRKQDGKN